MDPVNIWIGDYLKIPYAVSFLVVGLAITAPTPEPVWTSFDFAKNGMSAQSKGEGMG